MTLLYGGMFWVYLNILVLWPFTNTNSAQKHLACVVLQVCGVEALRQFSSSLLIPYKPTPTKKVPEGKVDELEQRVFTLRLQLKEAETELDRLRKGKQKIHELEI